MHAAVLDRLGPDATFRIAEVPIPEPGPGQVRLRVRAIGVNPVDNATRSGWVPLSPPPTFPLVLGWDVAGDVDAVGAGVDEWAAGDPVLGFSEQLRTRVGTYAEYVVLNADDVAPQPDGWGHEESATLPSSGLTALQAVTGADPRAGEHVVVIGATGVVGSLVTQIATARGARVVAVVGSRDADRARALGATDVVDRTADVVDAVRAIVPGGVESAINAARDAGPVAIATVRDGGRFATVADSPPPPAQRGITPVDVLVHSDRDGLRELSRLAGNGSLTTRVADVLGLDDAERAHALVAAGGLAGKVVLRP